MLPINYLHERKTMIKSKKNTIGIVKDTICKIALNNLIYVPPGFQKRKTKNPFPFPERYDILSGKFLENYFFM